MHRAIDVAAARSVVQTASQQRCPHCDRNLVIHQHRDRFVFRLDEVVHQICRDKRCPDNKCEGYPTLYRPLVDLRLALPRMSFGLDVVMAVGEGHLGQGRSLSELGVELTERGVPIHQTHVGRLLRNFLALCKMERGDEEHLRKKLIAQGGIVLMVDGVQFDERSPVLYLCWDALSGTALFGERMQGRGAKELGELLRKVHRMGVPVLGIVTDAERGLVPAVQQVFPQVPHQLCHTHFLKNCAKPMETDLRLLAHSVAERAEKVRLLNKGLDKNPSAAAPAQTQTAAPQQSQPDSGSPKVASVPLETAPPVLAPASVKQEQLPDAAPLSEQEMVRQMCAMVKLTSRASGKAPLNPPEWVRHQHLEQVRLVVKEAQKKRG